MILVTRPFDLHDQVRIGSADGKVVDMTLVATTIASSDNTMHVIPNRQVWNGTILNFTRAENRRVDIEVSVPHDVDLAEVERLLRTIVVEESRILSDPAAQIQFGDTSESAVTFWVRVWVSTPDHGDVSTAMKRKISQCLKDAGISVPYPRLQLSVESGADADNPLIK